MITTVVRGHPFALSGICILLVTCSDIQHAIAQKADEAASIVAFLMTAKGGTIPDEKNKIGTGFFVVDTKTDKAFLVTAKHLIPTLTPKFISRDSSQG
jgi:hypothetical protein